MGKVVLFLASDGRRDFYGFCGTFVNALAALDTIGRISNVVNMREIGWTNLQALLTIIAGFSIQLYLNKAHPIKKAKYGTKRTKISTPKSTDKNKEHNCHRQCYQMHIEKGSKIEFWGSESVRNRREQTSRRTYFAKNGIYRYPGCYQYSNQRQVLKPGNWWGIDHIASSSNTHDQILQSTERADPTTPGSS